MSDHSSPFSQDQLQVLVGLLRGEGRLEVLQLPDNGHPAAVGVSPDQVESEVEDEVVRDPHLSANFL